MMLTVIWNVDRMVVVGTGGRYISVVFRHSSAPTLVSSNFASR